MAIVLSLLSKCSYPVHYSCCMSSSWSAIDYYAFGHILGERICAENWVRRSGDCHYKLQGLGENSSAWKITDVGDVWFQQDGGMAHTLLYFKDLLGEHFTECLISVRGDLVWPACSPDLATCDFHGLFWICLKWPSTYLIRRTTYMSYAWYRGNSKHWKWEIKSSW